jgi:ABC-2 type transport system ATP-binding protein
MNPIIRFEQVSKWYGNVIGLNHLSLDVEAGVTGLLGPNGAGKSTLLQLATGQLSPSQGRVNVLGAAPWSTPGLNRRLGLCPEQDAFWEWMSGREFVRTCAKLSGMSHRRADAEAVRVLERVSMTHAMDRPVRGYSKGMRQRTKIAQAIVHDPEVLFLDEPLTGTDPIARRDLINIILELGREGRTVLVSSHVLHEVQAVTSRIVVINRGRLVAEGQVRDIRNLIDKHPHRITLTTPRPRELAAECVGHADVVGVEITERKSSITVNTTEPDAFYSRLPALVESGQPIDSVWSEDDSLEAVFKYLVPG